MENLTTQGRQTRKHKGSHAIPISPTPVAASVPSAPAPAPWTEELRYCCIQLYLAEIRKNKGADNGIKSQQWTSIITSFKTERGGDAFTLQQLQSCISYMKKRWATFHAIVQQSGFGWCWITV